MSVTTAFAQDMLKLLLQGVAIANIADNAASSPATHLYIGLYESEPGIGGNQTTGETGYTGYAREVINRNSGAWDVSSNQGSNLASIAFPQNTAGTGTLRYGGIGLSLSGTGKLLLFGPLRQPITLVVGMTPTIPVGGIVIPCA